MLLHELAHAHVARKLGYKLNKVYLLPYGACLSFEEFAFNGTDEIKIAIAGPIANVLLIFITVALWWIFPFSYLFTYSFVISNFSLALFNLLPAFPLDGGRVLAGLINKKYKRSFTFKVVILFNLVVSLLFFILFIISLFYGVNFSFGIIAIFLFVGIIEGKFQGKYGTLLYEFSNRPQKYVLPIKNIYTNLNTPLYKLLSELSRNKYNLIYIELENGKLKVLNETYLKQILLAHKPHETLKDCLKFN